MSRDGVSSLFWLAVAIFAVVQGYRLKLGTLHEPGPGFFPFWGGVVLAVLSLVLLLRSRTPRTGAPAGGLVPGRAQTKLVLVSVALLAYILLLETAGFALVTFLFLLLLFRLERKGWTFSAGSAVLGAVASYVIFQVWLKTQLPVGPFGF